MLEEVCFNNQIYNELVIGGSFGTEYYSNILYSLKKCTNKTNQDHFFKVNSSKFSNYEEKPNNTMNKIQKKNVDIICKSRDEIDIKLRGGFFEFF